MKNQYDMNKIKEIIQASINTKKQVLKNEDLLVRIKKCG